MRMTFEKEITTRKIIALIADQLGVPLEDIVETTTLEQLGADSLDRVEIIMKLEEDFTIEIDDAAAEKLNTVGDAIDYVQSLLK